MADVCYLEQSLTLKMKIAVAQTKAVAGDITCNLERHYVVVQEAAREQAALVLFPELSLTGYEPKLANALAFSADDHRLNHFQILADAGAVTLCIGLPLRTISGINISMMIFQPGKDRITYSKQHLHPDELPYFAAGTAALTFPLGSLTLAPAICYESLVIDHARHAATQGAQVYLVSVAKSAEGLRKAIPYYQQLATHENLTVVMANAVGTNDDFVSAGQSGAWSPDGTLAGPLSEKEEGILVFNLPQW
jgi:predicted amidohydrolase